jgi:S-adenosylmethionine-diacylglycerol 3-amino-3-carboxypropyl transferase
MPEVAYVHSTMDAALAESGGDFDYVHLSNILDWLSPDEARHTLARAAEALRPGGYTLIRQLNSTLDIPALGPQFDWDVAGAAELHARDRSFFYRSLHLGRRR